MSDMNHSFGADARILRSVPCTGNFEPFAQELARHLQGMLSGQVFELAAGTGIVTSALVFELAAGTGIVTSALARTLPATVAITATDLNPAMLDEQGPVCSSPQAEAGRGLHRNLSASAHIFCPRFT